MCARPLYTVKEKDTIKSISIGHQSSYSCMWNNTTETFLGGLANSYTHKKVSQVVNPQVFVQDQRCWILKFHLLESGCYLKTSFSFQKYNSCLWACWLEDILTQSQRLKKYISSPLISSLISQPLAIFYQLIECWMLRFGNAEVKELIT